MLHLELFFESKVLSRAVELIVELALLLLQGFTVHITSHFDHLLSKHSVVFIQNGSGNALDLCVVVTHCLEDNKWQEEGLRDAQITDEKS